MNSHPLPLQKYWIGSWTDIVEGPEGVKWDWDSLHWDWNFPMFYHWEIKVAWCWLRLAGHCQRQELCATCFMVANPQQAQSRNLDDICGHPQEIPGRSTLLRLLPALQTAIAVLQSTQLGWRCRPGRGGGESHTWLGRDAYWTFWG